MPVDGHKADIKMSHAFSPAYPPPLGQAQVCARNPRRNITWRRQPCRKEGHQSVLQITKHEKLCCDSSKRLLCPPTALTTL